MRKFFLFSFTILVATSLKSQHFAHTGFGGYNLRDKMEFRNAFGYINDGGFWAISAEGVTQNGAGAGSLGSGVSSYSSIYQLGFAGGISYDFQ